VTDRNPRAFRGLNHPDPHAEESEGETPPGTYPTKATADSETTCETCWETIPAGQLECPHCGGVASRRSESDDDTTEGLSWSFGRVVIAVIPAHGPYHARAIGAAAFDVSNDIATGPDVSHGKVQLRAEFTTTPARHLTTGWPDLPAGVPLTEPTGTELFETAVDRTQWTGLEQPHIYLEDGQPVTSRADLESLRETIDAADSDYWVVPGFVRKYPESAAASNTGEHMYCARCRTVTAHKIVGHDGIGAKPHHGRPIWGCTTCGQPRHQRGGSSAASESYTRFDLPFEGPPNSNATTPEIRE
jgi:hypothetical protein